MYGKQENVYTSFFMVFQDLTLLVVKYFSTFLKVFLDEWFKKKKFMANMLINMYILGIF